MAPLKTTLGRSVGKLIESWRGRDAIGGLKLNSTIVTNDFNATYGATGGNHTVDSPTHKYHVFTSPGTFAVTGVIPAVDIVVVGGGGGGYPGNPAGGGGGGGGVFIKTLSNQSVDLLATIGEGGNPNPNTAGESSILATPTSPTAYVAPGGYFSGLNAGAPSYPPTGASNGPELFQGGSGGDSSGDTGGGGGGSAEAPAGNGADGVGGPGCSSTGAAGGIGQGTGGNFAGPIFAPIMPTDFVDALGPAGRFGGGGAGAIRCAPGGSNTPGTGGEGGGGRGGAEPNHPGGGDPGRSGGDGVANTGGGGGGAHSYGGVGGAGGDGVVICRYEIAS